MEELPISPPSSSSSNFDQENEEIDLEEGGGNSHKHWNVVVHVTYRMFLGHAICLLGILSLASVMYLYWHVPFVPALVILSVGIPLSLILLVLLSWQKESVPLLIAFGVCVGITSGGGLACVTQSAGVLFFFIILIGQCAGMVIFCVVEHREPHSEDLRKLLLVLSAFTVVTKVCSLLPYAIVTKSYVTMAVVASLCFFIFVPYYMWQARNASRRKYSLGNHDTQISIVRMFTDAVDWLVNP